jgi:hypothetical protein
VAREAADDPEMVRAAPHTMPVRRLDEAAAARRPVVRQRFPEDEETRPVVTGEPARSGSPVSSPRRCRPMSIVKVLPDALASGGAQMALDDGLLDTVEQVMARRYTWAPPALSLGKFQTIELRGAAVRRRPPAVGGPRRAARRGLRVVVRRRLSTRCVGRRRARQRRGRAPYEPRDRRLRMARCATSASLSTTSARRPISAPALCFTSVLRHDLMSRGEKLVALAQARREGRVLVHGSVLERRPPASCRGRRGPARRALAGRRARGDGSWSCPTGSGLGCCCGSRQGELLHAEGGRAGLT